MVCALGHGYEIRHTPPSGLRVGPRALLISAMVIIITNRTSADDPQRGWDRREPDELALADVLPVDLKGDWPISAERQRWLIMKRHNPAAVQHASFRGEHLTERINHAD